jgi:hypothetical protein
MAVTASMLAEEGRRIADEGGRRGLTLKLSGGVAFYLMASDPALLDRLGRDPIRDLDFIGRSDERTEYKQLFGDLGYEIDEDMLLAGEGRRFLFQKPGEVPSRSTCSSIACRCATRSSFATDSPSAPTRCR